MLDGRAHRRGWSERRRLSESRVGLVELPHLGVSSPLEVAAACVSQQGVTDRLEAAIQIKFSGNFVCYTLVLDETIFARASDGLLVEEHRIEVSAIEASDLSRYQGVLIEKGGRIVLRPLSKLLCVPFKLFEPLSLPIGLCRLKEGRDRERSVVVVVKQLDATGRGPEQHLCILGSCEGCLVVAQNESPL